MKTRPRYDTGGRDEPGMFTTPLPAELRGALTEAGVKEAAST